MSLYINKVDNANVYLDGNNFLGHAKSIKLPEFEIVMGEHKNLGMVGTIKTPSGVEALEGEIVWDGYYPEKMVRTFNPYKAVQLMVRANVAIHNGMGRQAEVPLVTILNVFFSKTALGEYKPQENSEFSNTYSATSVKQMVDGKETLYFDAFNNIYRVGGEDILSRYRQNIG